MRQNLEARPLFYRRRFKLTVQTDSLPPHSHTKIGAPTERKELEVTDDGWMVAAPPKRRRAYRREFEHTESVMSEVPADTERVGSLVVREYVPPGGRARRTVRSGKDFKRCEFCFPLL